MVKATTWRVLFVVVLVVGIHFEEVFSQFELVAAGALRNSVGAPEILAPDSISAVVTRPNGSERCQCL